MAGPGRSRAPLRGCRPGVQQSLQVRQGRRIGDAPSDRRRHARDHGRLGARRGRRAPRATSLARVVGARVRGSLRSASAGGHRRRGSDARSAPAFPDPATGTAGADRAAAPRSLPVRRDPGRILGGPRSAHQDRGGVKSNQAEGELMDIVEIEKKETMSREEAAARLRAFADTLARNNDIEFERGGMQIKVHVPDEIHVKVELELETDKRELEIELTW